MGQRTALVTGSSGGIGTAIVERLRAEGLRVIALDIAGDVDLTVDIVRDPLPAEVFDHIDVCVSNAAIVDTIAPAHSDVRSRNGSATSMSISLAHSASIQACLPGMRAASIRPHRRDVEFGRPYRAVRSRSPTRRPKAGCKARSRPSPPRTASYGITANSVLPGFVADTGACRHFRHAVRVPLVLRGDTHRDGHAMPAGGRRPHRVPCSGESTAYITGQEIAIDGGLSLHQADVRRRS